MGERVIIGFHGKAEAGKSTAAEHLVRHWGFHLEKMAGPLKDMLRVLGLTDEHIEGRFKEKPCHLIGGKTPRQAMLWLGTEWGRDMIHPDLWTDAWNRRIDLIDTRLRDIVCDDVRFPNEAAAIRKAGGKIVVIHRREHRLAIDHESERHKIEGDFDIVNTGKLHEYHDTIDRLMEKLLAVPNPVSRAVMRATADLES
jgi:hypothetical protein